MNFWWHILSNLRWGDSREKRTIIWILLQKRPQHMSYGLTTYNFKELFQSSRIWSNRLTEADSCTKMTIPFDIMNHIRCLQNALQHYEVLHKFHGFSIASGVVKDTCNVRMSVERECWMGREMNRVLWWTLWHWHVKPANEFYHLIKLSA